MTNKMNKRERLMANVNKTRNLSKLAREIGSTPEATRFYLNRLQRHNVLQVRFINGPRGGVSVRILCDFMHPAAAL